MGPWSLLAALLAQAPSTFDLASHAVGPSALVCDVDLNVLRGDVRRLSWAPNSLSLHLQTQDGRDLFDYIVDLGNGEISHAFGEPVWSSEYWTRKSALTAPGVPSLRLDVIESQRRTRPTPFQGGFISAGQTPDPKNPVDTFEIEVTLRYLGEEIGHWVNGAPMAGDTFGWGPDGSGALIFTDGSGRIRLIDRSKRTLTLAGMKDAAFPAWSPDGARVAFLQKSGRRKYRLMTAVLH